MQFQDYKMSDILPHADPMILVDQVEACGENSIQASVTIRPETPFLYDGQVPSYVGIEYMAQTVASYSGIKALNGGGTVREGYLVSSRKLSLATNGFTLGETLMVEASVVFDGGEMAAFDCLIRKNDEILATARLNVYQPLQPVGADEFELGQGSV